MVHMKPPDLFSFSTCAAGLLLLHSTSFVFCFQHPHPVPS